MSTATTRLRRAGAGGLAAAVVAGMLVASAGAAFAAPGITAKSSTTVYPAASNQAAGDLTQIFPNSWATNAAETYTIERTGAVLNNCSSAAGIAAAIGFSAAPTFTLTGPFAAGTTNSGSSTDTKPTFTVSLGSSSTACATAGVKDQVTVTFGLPSTGVAGDEWHFAISGNKYNVGSGAALGNVLVYAAALAPSAGFGGAGNAVNAVVANTKFMAASVVPAVPSATGVALAKMTVADVDAQHITSPITFTLPAGAGAWSASATPTLSGPAGTTWTVARTATVLTASLATGTIPTTTANSYTLSGAQLDAPATAGVVSVTAKFGAAAPGGTTIGTAANVASVVTQARVGGSDRYATAAALYNSAFSAKTSAVLASGANFPDALSANFLASQLGTGTLLTTPLVLPSVTLNTIINDGVSTVYIVGGPGAVSNAVENQIAATHVKNIPTNAFISVVRVWGVDRYATNKAVNEYNFATHSTAIIATGATFADALSVGPAVYNKQYPLVLTSTAALSASAQQQLTDMGVTNVFIVGGTGAVSSAVETAIKGMGITITARLAGTDRTQTAAAIATWETTGTSALAGLGFGQATAHVANGADFPDALAAGPVAGGTPLTASTGRVILLSLSPTSIGAGAPDYLGGLNAPLPTAATVSTLNALGLTGAVSPAVMNAAAVALAG